MSALVTSLQGCTGNGGPDDGMEEEIHGHGCEYGHGYGGGYGYGYGCGGY